MKLLQQIDEIIKGFNGKPIQGVEGPLTIRDILLQCIGTFFTSPDAKETIRAHSIGQRLYAALDSIDLEDADFDLLEKAVMKTLRDQHYTVQVMTPILQYIESIKEQLIED